MDFYDIVGEYVNSKRTTVVSVDFKYFDFKDLMIQGGAFYAFWDKENGVWSTSRTRLYYLIDKDIRDAVAERQRAAPEGSYTGQYMRDAKSGLVAKFLDFCSKCEDNFMPLDMDLTFSEDQVVREDYRSKRLKYTPKDEPCPSFDLLMDTLYNKEERTKLMWSIGAIVSGDSKWIEKFIVMYGDPGSGKSTVTKIINRMFNGYTTEFNAKELTSANNQFSTEVFASNPLVAIQDDGDLSKIEDNTKLNSIASHAPVVVNQKYKAPFVMSPICFLYMSTNKPVKITDAKSGLLRRLIDVRPSGQKLTPQEYHKTMTKIKFEYPGIAWKCLQVYKELGPYYYDDYRPNLMQEETDFFYNFIMYYKDVFENTPTMPLKQAWAMYKDFMEYAGCNYKLTMVQFKAELKDYYEEFIPDTIENNVRVYSVYRGFHTKKVTAKVKWGVSGEPTVVGSLVLEERHSLLDDLYADCFAQYSDGTKPITSWDRCTTKLRDLDTSKEHFVRPPDATHIVIDFDIKDENGKKCRAKNLEEASKWPKTYTELSRSGEGVHLHYIWDGGDPALLERYYDTDIEVKVYTGKTSIRRRVTYCNNEPIAHLSSGLAMKGAKMVNFDVVKTEKGLRKLIEKGLNREVWANTAPSIDYINKILSDAYDAGTHYDVTDMRPAILAFANSSTHQAEKCIRVVMNMKFKSEEPSKGDECGEDQPITFFDCEVFPNLLLINWKYAGDSAVVRMINPTPQEVGELLEHKLVGFNCRRYDNHILYARYIGYTNEQLYELSQRIVHESRNCMFSEAYNLSYTDVYDFASAANKQSLKKFEIQLGLHHQELGLPWDKPVPEELWPKVAEYCDNDVISTEATFNYLHSDWVARQMLAKITGCNPNTPTNTLSAKLIFGDNKHAQDEFIYTDLSEMFEGYKYENGKSCYRGEDPGEGGYVYAEPGIYTNVALLDVASMHPSSIIALNLFGDKYTKRFAELKQARVYIKHKDKENAAKMMDGALAPFLDDPDLDWKALANALKTVINSVYGLTSAKFDNPFRDPRNIDNIVAKRGALFMINLKRFVQERGFTVAHIKTDSIKIPNATPEIIKAVMDYGEEYGYTFEHEATYERMCLVNKSTYIARYSEDDTEHPGQWTATGAQFQHPYVFATMFTGEPFTIKDIAETKTVSTAIHLNFNEGKENTDNLVFVGKAGSFVPIKPGHGGGLMMRDCGDGRWANVSNTTGYRWMETETVIDSPDAMDIIDFAYYDDLKNKAIAEINKWGSYDRFVDLSKPYRKPECPLALDGNPPWELPCGTQQYCTCQDCPSFLFGLCEKGYTPNC